MTLQATLTGFRRYKALAEGAVAQVDDEVLSGTATDAGNSIAVLLQHLAGNLTSRFTELLCSDGEKPWRQRDREFERHDVGRDELLARWQQAWAILFAALADLGDEDLGRTVHIRGLPLTVGAALQRSLAHVAYHVGQIVLLARSAAGPEWQPLSIPPGGSEAYNRNPTREKGPRG